MNKMIKHITKTLVAVEAAQAELVQALAELKEAENCFIERRNQPIEAVEEIERILNAADPIP